jgi:hypothetical protein
VAGDAGGASEGPMKVEGEAKEVRSHERRNLPTPMLADLEPYPGEKAPTAWRMTELVLLTGQLIRHK